ncbi:MAG: SCO family protein [Phycisphaeraceae bacterium]
MFLRMYIACLSVFAIAFAATAVVCAEQAVDTESLRADQRIPDELEGVGIDPKLGESVPLEALFTDEHGQPASLQKYFDGKRPVILNLGYYGCPMLCGLVMNGMTDTLKELSLQPGDDYIILSISIDPTETYRLARLKKQSYLRELGKVGGVEGWHFLTGNEANIRKLTDAVGFNYKWIERRKEYAHSAALILLTPDGNVSTYLHGIRFAPVPFAELLRGAAAGELIPSEDLRIWNCLHTGSPHPNSQAAMNLMRVGGVVTLIVLLTLFWRAVRRERRAEVNHAA